MPEHYKRALAYIQGQGYAALPEAAGACMVQQLQAAGLTSGLVVELGCGAGDTAAVVSAAGYEVLASDISPAMVELAKQKVPAASFEVASAYEVNLPACIGIMAIGEVLAYQTPGQGQWEKLQGLFVRAHAALQPGGILLFDLIAPGLLPLGHVARSYNAGPDWLVAVEKEELAKPPRLRRSIHSFVRAAGSELYARDYEEHLQRLYTADEVEQLVRAAGFTTRLLASYGAQAMLPKRYAILGSKA